MVFDTNFIGDHGVCIASLKEMFSHINAAKTLQRARHSHSEGSHKTLKEKSLKAGNARNLVLPAAHASHKRNPVDVLILHSLKTN